MVKRILNILVSNRKRRIALGILLFLLVVIVIGGIILHTESFKNYLLQKANSYVQKTYGLSLHARRFDYSLLRLSVVLDDVQVKPVTPEASPLQLFAAQRLFVNLPLSIIFSSKYHVQQLRISHPQIVVTQQAKNKADSPQLPQKGAAKKGKPTWLRIDEFDLTDGILDYNDRQYSLQGSISGIEAQIRYSDAQQKHRGVISSRQGEIGVAQSILPISNLSLEFRFDSREVNLDKFSINSASSTLEASGWLRNYQEVPQYNVQLKGSLRLSEFQPLFDTKNQYQGPVLLTASVEGEGSQFSLTGSLAGQDITVYNIPIAALDATIRGTEKELSISRFDTDIAEGKVAGELNMTFSPAKQYSVSLDWHSIDLAALAKGFPQLPVVFASRTGGRLKANWQNLNINEINAWGDITFDSQGIISRDKTAQNTLDGHIEFEASQGTIKIPQSQLSVNKDSFNFSGTLDRDRNLTAQFRLKSEDLSSTERLITRLRERIKAPLLQKIPPLNLAGRFSASGNISGSLMKPEVTLDLEGAGLRFRQLSIDEIKAALSYKKERITIARLLAALGEGRMEASGYISYDPLSKNFGEQAELNLRLNEVDIGPIVQSLPIETDAKGIFSGEVMLSGNIYDPTLDFDVALSQLVIKEEDIARIEASGNYKNKSLIVDRLKVVKGEGTVEGKLSLDLPSKSYSASLVGQRIDLQSIKSLKPAKNGIGGQGSLWLEGRGTFDQPQFSLRVSAEKLRISKADLQSLELNADSDGKTVKFDAMLPEAKTTLEGNLQFNEPLVIQGKVTTTDLNVENIVSHLESQAPIPFATELTSTTSFSIPLRKMEDATVTLEMPKARLQYQDITMQNSGAISITLANREVDIQSFHLVGSGTEFNIYGKLPLTDEREGKIQIDSRIDLRLLQPWMKDSQVAGDISLTSEIKGSLGRLRLSAEVELKEAALTDPRIPYRLSNIALNAIVEEDLVRLRSFTANLDNGSISASGSFSLASLPFRLPSRLFPSVEAKRNELKVTVSNLDIGSLAQLMNSKFAQGLQGAVDGEINIGGNFSQIDRIELEGKISRLLFSLSELSLKNEDTIRFSLREGILSLKEARFSGEGTSIRIDGQMGLAQQRELDVRLQATLDNAILAPFVSDMVPGGTSSWELLLTGPLNNPAINGTGEIKDGFFQLSTFAITASNVRGRMEFSEHTVTLSSLQGVVNGGPFNVQGDLQYHQFNIKSAELKLSANNVQLNYPEGLLSQSNINMSLEGEGKSWLLSGEVKLLQALYRKDVYPGSQLMSAMVSRRPLTRGKRPEALQNVKLDIRFDTVGSIIVDNNMASLELYGDLRITGTALRPIVTGRISMRYTGEVVFAEHRYQIERAVIDFLGTEQLDPNLDIAARTKMKHKYDELDIQLALSGPLSNLSYSLSSSPPRSEEEIASLLITGRSLDEVKSESANIIGEQMLFYFASPIASPLTKQLQKVLGIEEVTIEPINIATEEDPGARFTFTKRMSDDVSVTYSVDVSNSQQQTWLLDYNLGRNFSIRSFRKDDGSYGSSFRHRFTFGSQRPSLPKAAEEQRAQQFIKGVEIEGDVRLPRQSVIKKIKPLKVGSAFDYGKLRTVIENLIAFYKSTGYINAVITPTIKYENDGDVYIVISILPQKPGSILYEGDSIPKKLKKSIVSSWDGRLFEDTALMESVKLILNHLRSKGFYDAEVRAEKKVEANRTRYNFHIRKGGQYRIRKFTVMGNKFIDSNTIEKLIKRLPLPGNWGLWILIYDFEPAKEAIESLYEDNGFLKAAVSSPRIEVDSEHHAVDIGLTIDEGPQSLVNSVEFSGNTVFTNEELIKGLKLVKDSIFRPSLLTDERNHLFNLYRTKGYQEIEIAVEVVSYSNSPNVNILYTIKEGVQHYIAEIQIVGNKRTPHTMILRELKFKKGDVLTLANLSLSKKRLYDMGIFESVHVYSQPLAGEVGQDSVIVEIREKANFAVTYGLRYNSELKLEGIGELGIYNIFGRARNGVVYYRQNELEKDLRFSLKEPYLFGKRLNTIYSFYYKEMLEAAFIIDEIGLSVQQQHQLPHNFSLSYLYSLHKIHIYELEPMGPIPFDISLFLSKLSTFLVRDTRDRKMDSQRGSFFSVSFTYSPEFLGSDLTFISMFGQVSFYQPLFSNVVWASNYRVGLADAFDQVLIPSERFFTGGGNSIRGFERDMVGPLNPYDQTAEGGEALFIMNQELRFPIHKWLRGVAFYDMGNVYSSLSDLNPFDPRHSIGFGLRLDTRFSLIRVDYGINLFPRPGEPRGVFFFSIGQAF